MNRRFRLRKRTDFERVRRSGTSYAHPLVVLIVQPNDVGHTRVGVSASRAVGGAVARNRARRRLRAAIHAHSHRMKPGHDVIFLARRPILDADFNELLNAVHRLLKRAGVLTNTSQDDHTATAHS